MRFHVELLVSCEWLAEELGADDLRILDATAFLPGTPREARAEYLEGHIAGAQFLGLSSLIDRDDPRPSMVPGAAGFAERMTALGISETHRIVIYDDSPLVSSARAWWLFQVMGARHVALLDGGIARWRTLGLPIESGEAPIRPAAPFNAVRNDAMIRSKADIFANLESADAQLLDARGADRFQALVPEPRAGMVAGHIPGSANLPYSQLLDADRLWKRGEALKALFDDAGVDMDRPLITTCGSGVTACNLLFGAALLGKSDVTVYDGSWSEWGADPDTPKATGPA
jgi:thiosulfate/3-mercaptopyruvate sulfurtransferase